MTKNIFDVVIGRGTLKWDAAWRVIEWLADPEEEHGLGTSFKNHLTNFCFGKACDVAVAVEHNLGKDLAGTGRWPDIAIGYPTLKNPEQLALIDDISNASPNTMRKINNLVAYAHLGRRIFPDAEVSMIAIADTTNSARFSKLQQEFAAENLGECRLLPLQTIATWIDAEKGTPVVQSFREWAESL